MTRISEVERGRTSTVIQCIPLEDFRRSNSLFADCRQLLTFYYIDPNVPLSYAIAHEATHVYIERAESNSTSAVFFARMPEMIRPSLPLVAYLGLSVIDRTRAVRGAITRLWSRFLQDARRSAGAGVVLAWYRTATPFGLYPARFLLRNAVPRSCGAVDSNEVGVVRELRQAFDVPDSAPTEHPFVVRGYAQARYNESETSFIAARRRGRRKDLLNKLDVQEERGDRLIMFGYVP